MAAIGHPIVGDNMYNPGLRNGTADSNCGDSNSQMLHLHAAHLEFPHPVSGARVNIACAPPF
jgi:23S rRNA-/tRNA-specific pseudouridylate synthase